ncbi:MAG: hypothetical protein DHS20C18_45590 [Saprospiraceae bacterium]|nr:MAG: hypothetical protein DHS20C18_45590 [Saprospiraceae bacterium]
MTKTIRRLTYVLFSFMLLLSMAACGGNSADKEKDADVSVNVNSGDGDGVSINIDTDDMEKGMEELKKNLNKLTDGKTVEVIDFRKLKDLLPNKVAGMEMTDSEGQKSGVAGFNISTAQATYEEGNKEIEITILDTGGFSGALMGMAAWSQLEMDKESKDGYERTTTIDGYKAFEKYSHKNEKGQIAILIGDRYILTIEGKKITENELKEALESIDIDELKDLI